MPRDLRGPALLSLEALQCLGPSLPAFATLKTPLKALSQPSLPRDLLEILDARGPKRPQNFGGLMQLSSVLRLTKAVGLLQCKI